jgi:hypothetical protein
MKHTIARMKHKLKFVDGKSKISLNGYAFIDENGGCIIIVYGEGRRDDMSKYLSEDGDRIGIKYKIINLLS